ncbi:MarR family winged helix-turn-helix transcriptional regulator [Cryptosporangium sp. NPDC048952]|uniref:MarR family winged helix-turn-helix transcriptional regulator n=1 Tax=Cryptosporangium sp. NPDC048952 TaxID=3363961 RepID=UPI00370F7A77
MTPEPLTADEIAFWRALNRAMLALPRALDADLLRSQRMSMSEYFVLMLLSETPGRRLRMSELAAKCTLSLSGVSRIVTRLERSDLVVRERACADGRGWDAVLTDAGFRRLEEAWPDHLASVRRHLFDHAEGLDLRSVTAVMERFATDAPEPTPCDEGEC